MDVPICEHIKPGGKRCGSPALRGHQFCYYHVGLRKCMPPTAMFLKADPNAAQGEGSVTPFPVPYLEDAASIQIGFMQVIHGVAHYLLEPRRAKLILSALHGAAANLKEMDNCIAQSANALPRKKPPAGVKRDKLAHAGTNGSREGQSA